MAAPLLEARSIVKRFPGVLALQGVDFSLHAGEAHVLLGENGAGKSTLIKILSGAYRADEGTILWEGRPVTIRSPRDAQALGIRVVYQEFNLVPTLSVAENIHLGSLPLTRRGIALVDGRAMRQNALRLLDLVGAEIDPAAPVESLSVAEKQLVEIARALAGQAKLLVLDEPTAALTIQESERLLSTVDQLKQQGVGIIYISHRMEEIRRVSDRITVMRDGRKVATVDTAGATIDQLVELMTGRTVQEHFPRTPVAPGRPLLETRGLTAAGAKAITFTLRAGEVLGITGPVGSGSLDLARALFGMEPVEAGEMLVNGEPVTFSSPRAAIAAGIAFLPEDRKELGLVLKSGVLSNMALASLHRFTRAGWLNTGEERQSVSAIVDRLGVATAGLQKPVRLLSGGNQQKVVLGKWLLRRPNVYIFAEPTRGVDIGAKEEIYRLMNQLTAEGAGILLVSSDLPEVLGMSDRVLVMHRGHMVAELTGSDRTQERVLSLAFSGGAEAGEGGRP